MSKMNREGKRRYARLTAGRRARIFYLVRIRMVT